MAGMLPVRPPEPPKRRGVPPSLVLWLAGVVSIVVLDQLWKLFHRFHISTSAITFLSFLAWLLVIALSLYGLAIAARWVLRKQKEAGIVLEVQLNHGPDSSPE